MSITCLGGLEGIKIKNEKLKIIKRSGLLWE